jgi:hypothetical protein
MQSMVVGAFCLKADAPSTMLLRSAVPLPRCAGQDERYCRRREIT